LWSISSFFSINHVINYKWLLVEGELVQEDSPGGLVVVCFFSFLFFLLVLIISGSNNDLFVGNLPHIKEKEQTKTNRTHQG